MDATITRTHGTTKPILYYWGMVKDMDDKQKLELISMLVSSMRLKPDNNEDEKESGFRNRGKPLSPAMTIRTGLCSCLVIPSRLRLDILPNFFDL